MIKSELVERIAKQNPHLYHHDAERIVQTVLDTIAESLMSGERVELRGFGAFSIRHRDARNGRNPRTGKTVIVQAKHVPHFKPGKEMKRKLNAPRPNLNELYQGENRLSI